MAARYVDFSTNLGEVIIELFEASAPLTVANFLTYVNNTNFGQGYTGSFLHRLVPGFVLQGGGYAFDGTNVTVIATAAPVVNEFSLSNTAYTVAMAKIGGNPNSATDQFFINLADNSANLDSQNGGFTVFAAVEPGSRFVVNSIAALPRVNAGSPFDTLPVTTTVGNAGDHLVVINSVRTLDALPTQSYEGDASANRFFGTNGSDFIAGFGGNDSLAGGLGNDTIDGGDGDDLLEGDLAGGLGTDPGNDSLLGGLGNDTLQGGGGTDFYSGGEGDDLIGVAPGGIATVAGDAGRDTIAFIGFGTGLFFGLQASGVQPLPGGGSVLLAFADGQATTENVIGTGFSDTLGGDDRDNSLQGAAGDDVLFGGGGADTLDGGAGNDTLYGGAGNDLMTGGAGNDTFVVDDAGDVVTEAAGGGTDTVFAAADWVVAANLEFVRLVGAGQRLTGSEGGEALVANTGSSVLDGRGGDDTLWGQGGDDALLGGGGLDTLRGAGGNDTLIGGAGNDQLVGGAGVDGFVFDSADWGYDQVFDFSRGEGDKLDFRGSGATFATLGVTEIGGATMITFGAARIDLYGFTGLLPFDCLFG